MRILIIEDDEQCMESLTLAFGYYWPDSEVISAFRGLQGLSLVKEEAPDAIILDLGLPDIAGLELLEQIRNFSSTPVMILTARNEEAIKQQGMSLGANDYMTKPFIPRKLITRLKEITENYQRT